MSQVSPSTTYSFLLGPFCLLSWWSALLDFPSAATKRYLCAYQQITDILYTYTHQVYLSCYTTDRMFLQFNIATFDDINTICWLRPDYVMQLVNIPVGLILLSNLTVLISAVATAYRSATFR